MISRLGRPLSTKDDSSAMSFLDFLSKPTRPLLGLDISSSAIKLIELSKSADGYRVEAYRVMPLTANTMVEKNIADIPALADTLEKLVAEAGTKLTDTAVAVSGSSVITIEAQGQYDYLACQTDNQYLVTVRPLSESEVAEQAK